jgi:CubicO group peptidase (beta-lactamase class C family)
MFECVNPMRLACIALWALVCAPRAEVECQRPVTRLPSVDSLVAAEFARDSVGSITIGVISRDGLVWTKSYGFADMATRRPATRATVYRIGSVTKTFTALMLHQLVERGRIRLADPVSRFLPEISSVGGLPADASRPTILQLATMTGGLPAEPVSESERATSPLFVGPVSQWRSKVLAALAVTHYEYAPGTRFSYSNLGYAALGVALERASGTTYLAWQHDSILEPLEMHRTRFELDSSIARDLATGYEIDGAGAISSGTSSRKLRDGRGYKVPAGVIFTTVDDLSRFVVFELGHGPESVLPHARLDSVFAGIVATSADMDVGYGLGFMSQRRGDFTWLGHSGGVPGYQALMYFDRDHQLGVVVFRNVTGGKVRTNRLAVDVLKLLIEAKLEAERKARATG